MIRFLTYSQFHNKNPVVGSTFLRVNQLIKYWDEADLYKYGENPDVLIFQKVYAANDYKFPLNFENIKILDICDPSWWEGLDVAETARAMDAITCPTENMANFMRQITKAPVFVVPDRFDVDIIPKPKQHKLPAKTVVWFGYSHNAELMRPAIPIINDLGLNLLVISNDDPFLHQHGNRDYKDYYQFRKYNEETIYKDLQRADFAILPEGRRPEDRFKSNNRTIRAILAGLPVAKTPEDINAFMKPTTRTDYMRKNYAIMKEEYDVRKSIKQYEDIISQVEKAR